MSRLSLSPCLWARAGRSQTTHWAVPIFTLPTTSTSSLPLAGWCSHPAGEVECPSEEGDAEHLWVEGPISTHGRQLSADGPWLHGEGKGGCWRV